jgi:SAM-dependent methyltransferase
VTDFFKYDFGYTWPSSYGHLVAALVFLLVAALAWRLAWPAWHWGNSSDRLRANVRAADAENRLQIRAGDQRALPFEAESFDAAVSAYVIDHFGKTGGQQSLAEMARVLRPRGQFLLMVINTDAWVRFAYPLFYTHMYYGSSGNDRWSARLAAAGFDIVEQGTQPATLYVLAQKAAR